MPFLKKLAAVIASAAVAVTTFSVAASADEPFTGYNYDWWGDPIPSQNGFVVDKVFTGADMGIGAMSEPSDIFVHNDTGTFYIADSKNNRIIVTDNTFSPDSVRIIDTLTYSDIYPESNSKIKSTTFNAPLGVYVRTNSDGVTLIYVADSVNQ
ncbi:MAG: hypothetical protein ACI4J7_12480, partial [Ruminiclostridium sp.]